MSSLLLNLQKQENIEVESDATRQDNGKRIFSLNEILKFRNNIQMRDELIKSLENAENKNTVLESNNRELNKKKRDIVVLKEFLQQELDVLREKMRQKAEGNEEPYSVWLDVPESTYHQVDGQNLDCMWVDVPGTEPSEAPAFKLLCNVLEKLNQLI